MARGKTGPRALGWGVEMRWNLRVKKAGRIANMFAIWGMRWHRVDWVGFTEETVIQIFNNAKMLQNFP
jgi:hypothetical protein